VSNYPMRRTHQRSVWIEYLEWWIRLHFVINNNLNELLFVVEQWRCANIGGIQGGCQGRPVYCSRTQSIWRIDMNVFILMYCVFSIFAIAFLFDSCKFNIDSLCLSEKRTRVTIITKDIYIVLWCYFCICRFGNFIKSDFYLNVTQWHFLFAMWILQLAITNRQKATLKYVMFWEIIEHSQQAHRA
jgi:hypothetical protein